MNIEWWLGFFKWVLYVGAVFVAIGTIMVTILATKIDEKKEKKIQELQKKVNVINSIEILVFLDEITPDRLPTEKETSIGILGRMVWLSA